MRIQIGQQPVYEIGGMMIKECYQNFYLKNNFCDQYKWPCQVSILLGKKFNIYTACLSKKSNGLKHIFFNL